MARVSITINQGTNTEDYTSDTNDDYDSVVLPQLFKLFVAVIATRTSEMVQLREDIKQMNEAIQDIVGHFSE